MSAPRNLLRYLCMAWMLSTVLYSCKSSRTSKSKSSHSRTASSSRKSTYSKPSRPGTKATSGKAASASTETIIETARSFIGTPYKYGGTTRKGMDCSGLLFTSFKAVDINIPRTSQEQASMGKSVRTSDIQPGDLVFFTEKKGSHRISHVGMVTEVRDSDEVIFIHATNSRGVMEDNLFSVYYHKIFVKAVRPF